MEKIDKYHHESLEKKERELREGSPKVPIQ